MSMIKILEQHFKNLLFYDGAFGPLLEKMFKKEKF